MCPVSTLLEILRLHSVGGSQQIQALAVSTLLEILPHSVSRLATCRDAKSFQPFLRFYAPPSRARPYCGIERVSTLLEILHVLWLEGAHHVGHAGFQPFLRFYPKPLHLLAAARHNYVSTLLEILHP